MTATGGSLPRAPVRLVQTPCQAFPHIARSYSRRGTFYLFLPRKTASQRLRLKRSIAVLMLSCDGQVTFFERLCTDLQNRVNKVGLQARRRIPERIAMYNDTDSPKSVLDGEDAGGQTSGLSISATPPRFGRLAMCVARPARSPSA